MVFTCRALALARLELLESLLFAVFTFGWEFHQPESCGRWAEL